MSYGAAVAGGMPTVTDAYAAEAEAGYAPTPTGRLAQLGIEALDNGDADMVRICLERLAALGNKR